MRATILLLLCLLAWPAQAETTMERIRATGQITCGSFVFNHLFEYDPKTNQPTGYFADVMNEAAARMKLQPTFKEIGSFATGFEELKSGRYDMLCASLASHAQNYGRMLFSTTLFYDPIFVWGDAARDYSEVKALDDLNQPKWRIAGMDGELGGIYGPVFFPKATMDMVSQMAAASTILMDLFAGKADVVLLTEAAARAFEASDPKHHLKRLVALPVTSYPIRFVFRPEDIALKLAFDAVFEDMRADGTLERLKHKNGLD